MPSSSSSSSSSSCSSYALLTVVSEYLAALMRCIFILMFYFPPNGSNEQLRPVWSGLNWFSWQVPKAYKTSAVRPSLSGFFSSCRSISDDHVVHKPKSSRVWDWQTCSWYRLPTIPSDVTGLMWLLSFFRWTFNVSSQCSVKSFLYTTFLQFSTFPVQKEQ